MHRIKELGEVAGSLLGTGARRAGWGREGRGGEVAAPTQVQKPFVKRKRAFRGLSCWQVQASPSWMRALPAAPLNSRGSLVSHGFSQVGRVEKVGHQAQLSSLTRGTSEPWSRFHTVGAPGLFSRTHLQGAWCPAGVLLC